MNVYALLIFAYSCTSAILHHSQATAEYLFVVVLWLSKFGETNGATLFQ